MKQKKKVNSSSSKKSGLNGFFYLNYKKSLNYLKETKNYIWFSCILFFFLSLVGFFLPIFFEQEIFNKISELIEQTEGLNTLDLIKFIFINNLKSSFFAIFCGIFLGIVPFAILIVNGYVLGFVANKTVSVEGIFILWRLLPHGIFELPAVLISIAIGLKLGMVLLVYKGKNKIEEIGRRVLESLRVFLLIIIPLLVIAAIIEGILMLVLK